MAGFDIGAINGNLVLDSNKWNSAIDKAKKDMKSFEGAVLRSEGQLKKLGTTLTVVGASITAVSGLLVKMAADAQESENLFEVSMGNMADATRRWSKELSKDLRLNEFEVRKTVATFNVMVKNMGLSEKAAFQMSKELTKLTTDLASLRNLRTEEAFAKIRAGIAGESEPLKQLGIVINETTIKNFALEQGLIRQGQEMTEAQKIVARYGLILQQTDEDQGDLERTLHSLSNQFRSFGSLVSELGAKLGQGLIPIASQLMERMIGLVSAAIQFVDEFGQLAKVLTIITTSFGGLLLAVGPLLILLPGVAAAAAAMGTTVGVVLGVAIAVVVTFTAAVVGVVTAFQKWDFIKGILANFSASLNSFLGGAIETISNFVDKMGEVPLIGEKFRGASQNMQLLADEFKKNAELMTKVAEESFMKQEELDMERAGNIKRRNEEIQLSIKEMFDSVAQTSTVSTDKMKSGINGFLETLKQDFNAAEEAGRRTFNLLADSFSTLFFDAMTGEIKSFSELFADFGRSILKIMADIAAQWLAVKIITGIGNALGGVANAAGGIAAAGAAAASSTATTASGALSAGLDSSFGQFGQSFSNMQGLSLGGFADGKDRVPVTGFYKLHAGEQVVPSKFTEQQNRPMDIHIHNHLTPEGLARALSQHPAKDTVINIMDFSARNNGALRQRILER